MNKQELQDLVRNLQILLRCPSCGAHYKSEDIQFLGQVDLAWLLQCRCDTCELPIIATVMSMTKSDKPRKRISDFNIDEKIPQDLITADDILELHESLKSGEFEKRLYKGIEDSE